MKECYATLGLDDKFLVYTKHLINSIRHFDQEREIFLLTPDDIEIPTVKTLRYDFIETPAKPHLYINRNKPIGINKLLDMGYKVWYLDSDCIVLDDISSHFGNKEDITACVDWGWDESNRPSFRMDNFSVEKGEYLNAGVMLVNDSKAFNLSAKLCIEDEHYIKAWDIRNPKLSWRRIIDDPSIKCHNLMEQDLTNWSIYKTNSSIHHLDSEIYNYQGHMGDYEKLKPNTLKILHWSGGPDAASIDKRIEFIKDWNKEYYEYLNNIAKFEETIVTSNTDTNASLSSPLDDDKSQMLKQKNILNEFQRPPTLSEKLVQGVTWNAVGNFSTLFFTLFLSIYLTRVLGSYHYGLWSILISFIGIVVVIFNFGFDFTLNRYIPELKHKNLENEIRPLLKKMVITKMLATVILAPVLFFGREEIAQYVFHDSLMVDVLPVLALVLYLFVVEGIARAVLASYYEQKFLNIAEAFQRLIIIVSVYLLLRWKLEVLSVLLGYSIGQGFFLLICLTKILTITPPSKSNRSSISFHSFALSMYCLTVLTFVLGPQLDILMLSLLSIEPEEIALYSIGFYLAYMATSLFPMLLGGGITLTFVSELYVDQKKEKLRQVHSTMLEYMLFFNMPIAVGGIIVGYELITLLYSVEFSEAYLIFSLYLLLMILLKLGGITSTFLAAMDKEHELLMARTLAGTLNVFLNLFLIIEWGIIGAVFATGISGIIGTAWEFIMVHRMVKPKIPFIFLLKTLSSTSLMGLITWSFMSLIHLNVFFSIVISGVLYFLFQYFLDPFSNDTKDFFSESKVPFSSFLKT